MSTRIGPVKGVVTVRKVVISVLLAVAIVGFGYAFSSGRDTADVAINDAAVEHVEPKPGDLSPRQSRIGVDLKPGYSAALALDSTVIPDDQIEKVVGLDQYWYTPGPGTETGVLEPRRYCATATITKDIAPAGQLPEVHDYKWCFTIHS